MEVFLMDLKKFFRWEEATRDTIDVKKVYVDMADDLIAGVLLSQIVFWFLPNKTGKTKLRVRKEGHYWLVKGRNDWWEECRIKPRQFDTAIKKLEEAKLVIKKVFKFQGETKLHIRINWEHFLPTLQQTIRHGDYGGEIDNEYEDSIQADYNKSNSKKRNEYEAVTHNSSSLEPHNETLSNENGIYKSVNPDLHLKNLDNTGINKSVIRELQPKAVEITGNNETVNPELQNCNSGLTDFVNPITENTTEIIREEEDIYNNTRARANNTYYQLLQEYLKDKGLAQETINRIIFELIKRKIDSFSLEQIEKQYNHMMDKHSSGDRIYNFAVYFANGLKDLLEQSKSLFQEERKLSEQRLYNHHQKQADTDDDFPFYNWLEGKPTLP